MQRYSCAFWNLENLFATEDARRLSRLQREIGDELPGWNAAVLAKKTERLAEIISEVNDGHGPDICGVCEVENRKVIADLIAAISSGRN